MFNKSQITAITFLASTRMPRTSQLAGPAYLALYSGETDVATETVTGNTVTGAVARGRRRRHEGGETTELFYQWARAAPHVTSRPATPIAPCGAGHGTSRLASLAAALGPGASRSWDPSLA